LREQLLKNAEKAAKAKERLEKSDVEPDAGEPGKPADPK